MSLLIKLVYNPRHAHNNVDIFNYKDFNREKKMMIGDNLFVVAIFPHICHLPGNANRGWWGILKYPPSAKNFENTPLKILGKFFEKQGKNLEI